MTPTMLLAFFGILAAAAAVADRMPEPRDRYRHLADHADLGCGADEYRGPRRFTRPSDRTNEAPVRTAKHVTRASDRITHQETDQ
ncbi:hypothetical protein [Tsukamurella tyrosinosolvens]|uniref:hypothetical protein n=1 Tax=Tsukamurella tyrosinosolvens TaxID=57704 RepID=UPI000DF6EA67|nr:hypothetical protein [Tsukamurella tyrosinosolvens]RDB49352.1 hypothetical protein DVB87_03215 [Tsukamurella tyrosinosolvens]